MGFGEFGPHFAENFAKSPKRRMGVVLFRSCAIVSSEHHVRCGGSARGIRSLRCHISAFTKLEKHKPPPKHKINTNKRQLYNTKGTNKTNLCQKKSSSRFNSTNSGGKLGNEKQTPKKNDRFERKIKAGNSHKPKQQPKNVRGQWTSPFSVWTFALKINSRSGNLTVQFCRHSRKRRKPKPTIFFPKRQFNVQRKKRRQMKKV